MTTLHVNESADWNAEFQRLSSLDDSQSKYRQLAALASDFVATAGQYCCVIINELGLPQELKTIRSINVGGIAGGEKYERHGILFKFAVDQKLPGNSDSALYMYGGTQPDDEAAAKAASNELLGLMAYYGM